MAILNRNPLIPVASLLPCAGRDQESIGFILYSGMSELPWVGAENNQPTRDKTQELENTEFKDILKTQVLK